VRVTLVRGRSEVHIAAFVRVIALLELVRALKYGHPVDYEAVNIGGPQAADLLSRTLQRQHLGAPRTVVIDQERG
jgi:hypothetical protein